MQPHHRLEWRVAGLVFGAVLAAGALIGVLLALGNSKSQPPLSGVGGHAVQSIKGSGLGHLPGFGNTGAGGSIQTKTLSLTPTSGWAIVHKDDFSVLLSDPEHKGLLGFESGTLSGSPTTTSFAQGLTGAIAKSSTNAKVCGKVQPAQLPNGPRGIVVPVCYTIVPQNGRALQLYQVLLVAVSGKVGVAVRFITLADNATLKAFYGEANPVVASVHWKLLT